VSWGGQNGYGGGVGCTVIHRVSVTMHGSKTHPLAKCQLRRVPMSMMIDYFSFDAVRDGVSKTSLY
jgi:hypothetical protein